MKRFVRIICGVLVGTLLLCGGGYAGWYLDIDTGQQELLERAYRELDTKRFQNMSLQARCWNLEDQVFHANKDAVSKKRAFDRAITTNREFYEERIEDLVAEVEALEEQVALLQSQVVGEVKGEWGGLRDFHSFEELMQFLMDSDVDKLQYAEAAMDCEDYTALLIREAQGKGFRMYWVRWAFLTGQHLDSAVHRLCEAIVEETMPDGKVARWIVWIEPQSDEWIKIGLEDDPSNWREKILPFLP